MYFRLRPAGIEMAKEYADFNMTCFANLQLGCQPKIEDLTSTTKIKRLCYLIESEHPQGVSEPMMKVLMGNCDLNYDAALMSLPFMRCIAAIETIKEISVKQPI